MKESKVVVWEGLINSWEKKRSEKQRGKGEIYAIECSSSKTKGDKKALLIEQCKEIEENSRLGKTRNLFKKIGDTKGTFHEKIGTINDKNSKDLTEAERKSGKNTQKNCTKKSFMTQIIMMVW